MKHQAFLVLLFSVLLVAAPAQATTYYGDLVLSSQAEVDAFNYTEVTGGLHISGADITDLSPLSVLTTVGENLSIVSNDSLAVVDGFENLTSVGWYLDITRNNSLVVVDGFEKLTSVGWFLTVYYNPLLVSFSGFNALTSTGDNIDFWYNDSLVSISGFSSLETAGWSLEIGGNPVLTSIPEFESLRTITSSLFIMENPSLVAIPGFKALEYVDWSFNITFNTSLEDLCGFYNYFAANNPYTGGGTLDISNNHTNSPTSIQEILDRGPCVVPSPSELIADLIVEIEGMGLPKSTASSLIKSLDRAAVLLGKGDDAGAVSELEKLIQKILTLEQRKKLDGPTADTLITAVQEIIAAI